MRVGVTDGLRGCIEWGTLRGWVARIGIVKPRVT